MTAVSQSNYAMVGEGLRLVQAALAPFISRELKARFKNEWWSRVYYNVPELTRAKLPKQGGEEDLKEQVDLAGLLLLIDRLWNEAFGTVLPKSARTHANELRDHRNAWAHPKSDDLPAEETYRALDTMMRFVETFDRPSAKKLRPLVSTAQQAMLAAAKPAAPTSPSSTPPANSEQSAAATGPARAASPTQAQLGLVLKPWRDVIAPHPDVAAGRYQTAEFAADLADVLAGKAEADYQDPRQFFARTFLTEGMRRLMVSAMRRLAGEDGDPVIQLKTAFGGGKTHTMLALYHALRAGDPSLPGLSRVYEEAGIDPARLPAAKVAVLVGTDLDSTRERVDAAGNGVIVRTLWGEMAAQLGGQAAYELVASADRAGVAPGASTLLDVFTRFGPAVVLIDEFVAYARNIYGKDNLPAGSFDSNLTFIQTLTEAAKRSRNCVVIASIPESNREIGGEAGMEAQARLEQIFGRVETVWQPVAAQEGFEIVRRRLFGDVIDPEARDLTCRQFHRLYQGTSGDFPRSAGEPGYLERLIAAYPIHPEVFDRLYEDWATLEEFQRTRGVLRLMAAVIHALWRDGDQSPMIMPGDLPLHDTKVRWELTRYLPDTWNTVVDKDVDGERSGPVEIDKSQPRFGQLTAARRLARTIFLGTAPHVIQQRTRGVEASRIRLGAVQPNQAVATYNDALYHLADRLTYLYSGEGRYWYDTRPNLNRTAEERAAAIEPFAVVDEIRRRLNAQRGRGHFAAVHIFPESADVPDIPEARLVILHPDATHRRSQQDSPAITKAREILDSRGSAPRLHKNMLVFVAADEEGRRNLEQSVRRYLAWDSILRDQDMLNLDRFGINQATTARERESQTIDLRINEAFWWLLNPTQDEQSRWSWQQLRIPGSNTVAERASAKLAQDESLLPTWSGQGLKIELDRWFWKDADHVELRKVWDAFANYGYLPRLVSETVLRSAIADGLKHPDFFGYAQGLDEHGRYLGLIFNRPALVDDVRIDSRSVLVKPDIARRQLAEDEERERRRLTDGIPITEGDHYPHPQPGSDQPGDGTDVRIISEPRPTSPTPPTPRPRRYTGVVELDVRRLTRDADQIAAEIVEHLAELPRARVRVRLDIEAEVPDGIPFDVARVILENARTLKFTTSSLDDDPEDR